MTQLFGCICNQPERFRAAIEPARAALVAPGPVVRWGLGYVHSGEVLLRLHPRPSETDVDFFEATEGIATDYLIGAAHDADGLKGNANTQPFRFRRWLFAMEGSLQTKPDASTPSPWEAVGEHILEHIPDYLRRNMRGKTSAEHIFHLLLATLQDTGNMDHPNLEPAEARSALATTVALASSQLTRAGATHGLGNMIVTNGRFLLAARLDGPLFVRQYFEQLDPRRSESQLKSILIVSADENPGEGFEEVPARQIVSVSRDIRAELVPLDQPAA